MKKLNATLIYVLSSISLLCCCFGGLGILLALPSFLIANKGLKDAELNPQDYEEANIKAMSTAKTFALVTLIVNGLYLAYSIYSLATTDWDTFIQQYNEALERYR